MKTKFFSKIAFLSAFATLALVSSCNDDAELSSEDSVSVTEEAVTESYFEDMDDLAGISINSASESQLSGGRAQTTITVNDPRFNCNGVVVTVTPDETSTVQTPKGVLTIDFGATGCTDLRGNVRKGKLIITYNGRRFTPGATVTTTTENYYINDIKLEGTRTLTNVQSSTSDAPKFNVVLTNGKATFADGTFATRSSDITREWIRAANPVDDQLVIKTGSSASGTSRTGQTYEMDVVEDLVYKRLCGFAVDGIKTLVIDQNKQISIDYGDGTCDRTITVTVNGITRNVNVGN